MKTISTAALAALLATSIGLSATLPATAQDAPAAQAQPGDQAPSAERGFRPGGPAMRNGPGNLLNLERGAEAVEIALVRVSHRIELTTEQQALFDSLKSDALEAAATFEAATADLRPTRPAAGEAAQRPEPTQMLENGIAMGRAQLAALESVQPAFTAFFDSLTDEQKASLEPQRPGERGPSFGHRGGDRDGNRDRH